MKNRYLLIAPNKNLYLFLKLSNLSQHKIKYRATYSL